MLSFTLVVSLSITVAGVLGGEMPVIDGVIAPGVPASRPDTLFKSEVLTHIVASTTTHENSTTTGKLRMVETQVSVVCI